MVGVLRSHMLWSNLACMSQLLSPHSGACAPPLEPARWRQRCDTTQPRPSVLKLRPSAAKQTSKRRNQTPGLLCLPPEDTVTTCHLQTRTRAHQELNQLAPCHGPPQPPETGGKCMSLICIILLHQSKQVKAAMFQWNFYSPKQDAGQICTVWFQTGKGVRQGCTLSSCLFNLYAEYIMRNPGLDEAQAGIKIARRNINNLRYTDDTTLMAEREELKSLLMKVKEESEKVGLKLNI